MTLPPMAIVTGVAVAVPADSTAWGDLVDTAVAEVDVVAALQLPRQLQHLRALV